ncbi:MAG: hypothetical protein HY665_08080, partial [Chloroflexi bacterium]|nr:hypothetical protein [Chloroflexota bacterium]
GIRPTLKWSSITDPSGVTFVLQIDTTPHFTQPILEKAGILGNQYTLVAADALPRDEYYWRIKAVDGASNEGVWSEPQLLKSGLMPPWGLFTTIVLIVAAIGAIVYFFLVRVLWRRREAIPVPQVEMPQVFASRLRLIEPEAPSRSLPLPRRLALPQPAKRGKTIPAEEMAHLKVILDFAQSLPLVEPGYTADWLVDLLQTSMGIEISASVYEHLLKGELQVRYEPEWMSHPSYQSLTTLLQGQAVLQDLNAFVDSVNRCASEATLLLQDIYRDATAEIPSDFLKRGGWVFVCAVYSDALSWLLGKSLRSPSERDYIVKAGEVAGEETGTFSLWGEETTSFAGPLIEELDEQEASQSKALHLRLRRTYRNSDRARRLLGMMTQVEVQRQRLVNAFSQLGRITQQIS